MQELQTSGVLDAVAVFARPTLCCKDLVRVSTTVLELFRKLRFTRWLEQKSLRMCRHVQLKYMHPELKN